MLQMNLFYIKQIIYTIAFSSVSGVLFSLANSRKYFSGNADIVPRQNVRANELSYDKSPEKPGFYHYWIP